MIDEDRMVIDGTLNINIKEEIRTDVEVISSINIRSSAVTIIDSKTFTEKTRARSNNQRYNYPCSHYSQPVSPSNKSYNK